MKDLIRKSSHLLAYIARVYRARFTISGIQYQIDPCSVGRTPQGEMTAEAAFQMIVKRQLQHLAVLDMCCGVGIIGLTLFAKLGKQAIVREVAFSDINIFNLNSLHRTLITNNLDHLLPNRIRYYLSDGLVHVPTTEKFDIIVSNPPHYFVEDRTKDLLSPGRLGTYDVNWSFHKAFYAQCHNYLTERGEVWFLENGSAATELNFLPFINANPMLKYEGQFSEPRLPNFFWMITRKV